jgi:hypothetical protein
MKPKVKETEKSRVLCTKDFSLFEFPEVQISKKHLEFVKQSLLDKNLMPDFPILVDDQYKILDGKYKFLACYELKLPIYYKVAEVTTFEDAMRIKEISLKTPLSQIIQLYKDREAYSNVIFIKQHFKNLFRYKDILCLIESAVKSSGKTSSFTILDRYKIASGRVSDFDTEDVIAKLVKAKYIMDEFDWDATSSIQLLKYHNYNVQFNNESQNIRFASRFLQDYLQGRTRKGFHQSVFSIYREYITPGPSREYIRSYINR